MKPRLLILTALIALTLFHASPAAAEQRLIVRTTNVLALKQACLLNLCQVTQTLDGTLGQLFLVTAPDWVSLKTLESVLRLVSGVISLEEDILHHVGTTDPASNAVAPGLSQNTLTKYYGTSVWTGYAQQPASTIIRLGDAQRQFRVTGQAVVADIDTGVDFLHPALQGVLLTGYDFTRNRSGGYEMADVSQPAPSPCN